MVFIDSGGDTPRPGSIGHAALAFPPVPVSESRGGGLADAFNLLQPSRVRVSPMHINQKQEYVVMGMTSHVIKGIDPAAAAVRSEEHTSELQSRHCMRRRCEKP